MPRVSEVHLAARRAQILDGARQCFAKFGYEGATVRRLEETTGLSRGAIFHHFRDKDALFLALAHEDSQRMADTAAEQGLVQVMRNLLTHPEEFDWLGTRLEITRRLRTDPDFRREWAEQATELTEAATQRLERQRAKGRIRDDIPTAVLLHYLDLVLDGLVAHVASGQPATHLDAVLDLVEDSVRRKPSGTPVASPEPVD
ncbi:TetR/AcrR family transcriptional regulator [Lolliginicoccus suaedae]|uniref:TetR/AcrR family transcriptional regulator n=1 Tax=Lolliginicoccus suaedae TaxID=2605429 RepID=UPI0011ED68E6|nr:TetR/AcrR family transcriptional regulator [Lolliginicoccus suaedae]